MKKVSKPVAAVVDTRTPEEKLAIQKASAIRQIQSRLQSNVEHAQEILDHLKSKMTDVSNALYEIRWLEDRTKGLALGALSEQALSIVDTHADGDIVKAVSAVVEDCTSKLMNDYLRCASTSAFSNASEGAQRAAAASFVSSFKPLIKYATEEF